MAKCVTCGRFLSVRREHVSYTPFGSYYDLDPPGERYAHTDCFLRDYPGWITAGKPAWAWMGPTLHPSRQD